MAGIRNLLLSMARGVAAGIVTPFNIGALQELLGVGTSQATASVSFNTDGSVTCDTLPFYDPNNDLNDDGVTGPNYYAPPTAGIGASYWLLVNAPAAGTFTSGVTGTRQQLNVQRNYTATTTGTGITRQKYVRATYEIWNAATGGTKVGDGTLTLTARIDNS